MTTIIDNGNPTPLKADDRWTPKLAGEIFCSPACGANCTKKNFDEATESARVLASQLGYGWEPRVWENMGWHFEAAKRGATVSAVDDSEYEASIRFYMDERTELCVSETRNSPAQAVEAVVEGLNARIKALRRALNAISPEPLQLAGSDGEMNG